MTTTAKEAAEALANFSNNMGHVPAEFVQEMARQHRTLQQNCTGLMMAWLMHLASLKEGEYDLRNEASVQLAKKLLEGKDKYDVYLPFI